MERIVYLSNELTAKGPEKTPEMQKEIDRVQVQPKKVQILEDSRRVMSEWKSKATINEVELNKFVYGEMYSDRAVMDAFIAQDPDFGSYRPYQCSRPEARETVNKLFVKLMRKFPLDYDTFKHNYWRGANMFIAFGSHQPALATKIGVHLFLYTKTIAILGTEGHRKYIERALEMKDFGCFALTELTHGSNVQGCITTATYDVTEDSFVVNTPHERGMKFWIGNASHTANMAVVFANMIVKGKDYGIHPFIVEIRDPTNHNTMPGVTIGDCGDKMGLKGVDNGWLIFKNVKIPRGNLLDRVSQVDNQGNVTSLFAKKGKRFAKMLGALSEGRAKMALAAISSTQMGAVITCRYGVVRRQFGKTKYEEKSIIEYPSWQQRVFPYFAHSYIQTFGVRHVNNLWKDNYNKVFDKGNLQVKEMHALISVVKAITCFDTVNGLEQFRQACGGLGYSSYSRLPDLIQDLNVMVTWEGDNNVLLQQTSRFLLTNFNMLAQGKEIPFTTLKFLQMEPVEALSFEDEEALNCPFFLRKIMEARVSKAVQETAARLMGAIGEMGQFDAWNYAVPYNSNVAALAYGDLYLYNCALEQILSCPDETNRTFLMRLLRISTLNKIRESASSLIGYIDGDQIKLINNQLLALYDAVKFDLVKSFDGMNYSDNTLRSVLGSEDGNVYDRYIAQVMSQRENVGRPPYWKEIWNIKNSN